MNTDACRFDEKVVLVTGSSSGTGAAIARAFARSGARIALNCRSDLAGAKRLAAEITAEGHEAMAFEADLTDSSRTRQLAIEVAKGFGAVDILVNAAGPFIGTPLLRLKDAAWDAVMAALIHLTESLALELAPAVTVNAVIPSQIASARTDTLVDYKRAAIAGTPLGRLVTEEEIANVVGRICGPDFDFMTGRSIVLDGGRALPRFPKLELEE